MVTRAMISDEHWAAIEDAAKRRKIKTLGGESVTVKFLAEIRAAARGGRPKRPPMDPRDRKEAA